MNNQHLYLIALLPPEPVTNQINNVKQAFSEKYLCYKALRTLPHLTLIPPIQADASFETQLFSIGQWVAQQQTFTISLRNFNFFKNPQHPVVFIDVKKNEQLNKLYAGLRKQLKQHLPVAADTPPFHPHFTVGYRDIPPQKFPEIMKDYAMQRFHADFDIKAVYLLKHNTREWKVFHEFPMGIMNNKARGEQGSLFE